jgi:hypothetical protein
MPPSRRIVRGRADWERLSPIEREARHRAFEALNEMRSQGISLRKAAKEVGTSPATVHRYAGDSLVVVNGRYRATPSDRSYQRMTVLSSEGLRDVDTRGSRVRSLVGSHWNAIHRFASTGDVAVLRPFEGKRVGGADLATDPDLIEEYLRQGELNIDDIYV